MSREAVQIPMLEASSHLDAVCPLDDGLHQDSEELTDVTPYRRPIDCVVFPYDAVYKLDEALTACPKNVEDTTDVPRYASK